MKAEYAEGVRPTVARARVAYQGDLPELLDAGGKIIGELDASGNGFADQDDVREQVRIDAARRGATHVVFVSAFAEKDHTPVGFNTQCKNGSCTTTQTGGYEFYRPHATYILVKMPEADSSESWTRTDGDANAERSLAGTASLFPLAPADVREPDRAHVT